METSNNPDSTFDGGQGGSMFQQKRALDKGERYTDHGSLDVDSRV
jgi:hypothetical protein